MGIGLPFRGFSDAEKSRIDCIISDVDDTITSGGRLLPEALAALYSAKEAGFKIVLLTGGSAGWADVYARQWPVDGVIAESGALLISKHDGLIIYHRNPLIDEAEYRSRRENFISGIDPQILSSDQYARLYDVAIDKSLVNDAIKNDLIARAVKAGGYYAESSIHINIWFAPYDKWNGLKYFMSSFFSKNETEIRDSCIYLGDGLNDQPLFKELPSSIGMNSINARRAEFKILPEYITEGDGGFGFAEVIKELVKNNSNMHKQL